MALMRQKSGENRLKMGFSMFDLAMAMILASLPAGIDAGQIRRHIFIRLYSSDFNPEQCNKIIRYLQR